MSETIADPGKAVRLQELRSQLQALERGAGGARPPLALGLAGLDAHLGGGLPRGCLHEVAGAVDDGAAPGFCAALLGRLSAGPTAGPVLWCQPALDLYAPGLAAFGLDPARLIVVTARRPADRLWAMEEGLRCPALAAVLGELDALDLTAARRLQLAAETSGVTGVVLHPNGGRPAQATAVTRWKITAAASPVPAGSVPAGHGVHRSDSSTSPDASLPLDCHPRESGDPGQAMGLAALDSRLRGNDSKNDAAFPAGHGVHRSFSSASLDASLPAAIPLDCHPRESGDPGQAMGLAALDSRWRGNDSGESALCPAGHGVDRSFSSASLDAPLPAAIPLDCHPRESGDPGQATGLAALDSRWRGNDSGKSAASPAGHGVHRSFSSASLDGGAKWLGPARWRVELLRCRAGRPGRWLIEWMEGGWRDATGDVAVAAALRDRPDPPAACA